MARTRAAMVERGWRPRESQQEVGHEWGKQTSATRPGRRPAGAATWRLAQRSAGAGACRGAGPHRRRRGARATHCCRWRRRCSGRGVRCQSHRKRGGPASWPAMTSMRVLNGKRRAGRGADRCGRIRRCRGGIPRGAALGCGDRTACLGRRPRCCAAWPKRMRAVVPSPKRGMARLPRSRWSASAMRSPQPGSISNMRTAPARQVRPRMHGRLPDVPAYLLSGEDPHLASEAPLADCALAARTGAFRRSHQACRQGRERASRPVAPLSYYGAAALLSQGFEAIGQRTDAYATLATAWATLGDLLGRGWLNPGSRHCSKPVASNGGGGFRRRQARA